MNDFFRSSNQKVIKVGIDPDSLPERLLPISSEYDLSAALSGLPHIQRRAIELRYMNEWSFEKIAEEMSTTPENSRQIISRGIKKIRSFLKGGDK